MSRIAKKPIPVPSAVAVEVTSGEVTVRGPKGELHRRLHPDIAVAVADNEITVTPHTSSLRAKALWGTTAAHLKNMLTGVVTPFVRRLLVEGVGYRWEIAGTNLKLALGFSHPVIMPIPEGLTVTIEKGVLAISGPDKEQVTQFAANVRALKVPEPYKGKGIRYEGEVVRRKQGKKTV